MASKNYHRIAGMRFYAFDSAGPIPCNPMGYSWNYAMRLALAEAQKAFLRSEIPVGAVVIDPHGKILSRSFNKVESKIDPTAHAEIMALRMAAKTLRNHILTDCILVTTLEPCVMCAAAIDQARLAGVVYGAADLEAGALTSNIDYFDLPNARRSIWHMGGVMAKECSSLLKLFFQNKRMHEINHQKICLK